MSSHSTQEPVVLVLDAGTDAGYQTARRLLMAGRRIAVTDRLATSLCRITHGYSASQVFAIAADRYDHVQLAKVVDRAQRHFGAPVTISARYLESAPRRDVSPLSLG